MNSLTTIGAEERRVKEAEINEEYDERIKLTKQQLAAQQQVNNAVSVFRNSIDMLSGLTGMQSNLIIERDMLKRNTQLSRDRFNVEMNMMRPIMEARIKLDQDINAARLAEAKKLNKDINDLTDAEEQAIIDKFATEQEGIDTATRNYEKFRDVVLGIYDDLTNASRSFRRWI